MIMKMEHTAIIVTDIEKSIQFYSDLFGFKVRLQGSNTIRKMAFLYLESQPDMEIELIQDIDETTDYSESGKVNHLAFTVKDLEESIRYYRERGVQFISDEPKPTLEGGRMILFTGPDRELLQLVERAK